MESSDNQLLLSGTLPENNNIVLSEMKTTYIQNSDSCDRSDDYQELIIKNQDAGGGTFYVIKTERWAFDDPDDLLKDLKNKVYGTY